MKSKLKEEIFNYVENLYGDLKNDCGDGSCYLISYIHTKKSKIIKVYKESLIVKTEKKYKIKLTKKEYVSINTLGDISKLTYKKLTKRK